MPFDSKLKPVLGHLHGASDGIEGRTASISEFEIRGKEDGTEEGNLPLKASNLETK